MLIDATQIIDGKRVMLGKTSLKSRFFFKFSDTSITNDSCNHCVRISDVLEVPYEDDTAIIVMPFLRPFYTPRFETRGELLEFFRQILEVRMHTVLCYNY